MTPTLLIVRDGAPELCLAYVCHLTPRLLLRGPTTSPDEGGGAFPASDEGAAASFGTRATPMWSLHKDPTIPSERKSSLRLSLVMGNRSEQTSRRMRSPSGALLLGSAASPGFLASSPSRKW